MILLYALIIVGVLFFWAISAWSKIGYFVYLWQIKQYRWDRMASQLKEPGGLRILINRALFIKIALAVIALVAASRGLLDIWFYYAVYAVYILQTLVAIRQAWQRNIKFPIFTVKSLLLMLASLIVPVWAIFYVKVLPTITEFLLLLLIVDIFIPIIVTFFVMIAQPFTYAAKQYMVRQGIAKREALKKLITVGISGSVGKTSTKEFLAHILAAQYRVVKTKEHQNTEIGAARALRAANSKTNIFVAEMGAYRKGDITQIAQVVKPAIGIITSLGEEHLSLFGNVENAVAAEFELASVLPEDGTLVVNWDNEFIKTQLETTNYKLRLMRYSLTDASADVYATDVKQRIGLLSFTLHYKTKASPVEVNLLGLHNISNILGAVAGALAVGMKFEPMVKALKTIEPLPRTMKMFKGIGDLVIIDDSYNTSPQAVRAAFDYMSLYEDKTRIIIMPSLIELGAIAASFHEQMGKELAQLFDYAIITDNTYQEAIETGWQAGKGKSGHLLFESRPRAIAQTLKQVLDERSVILIEGRVQREVSRILIHHFYTD